MLSKFNALQIELSTFEQPDTKEACQEAIIAHTSTRQRVFSMNIEQLIADAKNLLKTLIGHDNNEILLAPGGTRDSGYSGSESEKFNCDYFSEASKIKEPMEQLRVSKQKVQNLWQQKKLKLEQCLQLRVFEQDCSQVSFNMNDALINLMDAYIYCSNI
jgi:kalirin